MVWLRDNSPFGKQLILYALVVSLVRGIFFPDFRHDMISIVFIQVVYPVALFVPMIMRLHGEHFWSYYVLCLIGVAFAAFVALLRYTFEAGRENATEQVSVAVLSLSFAAQIGLLSALVIVLFVIHKAKET